MLNFPTYFIFRDTDGTNWYMFAEDDGTLKWHSTIPTINSDGTAVGLQYVNTPSTDLENPSEPPPFYQEMISPNGTHYYLYGVRRVIPTVLGALMIHTAVPTRNDDGVAVGTQF